MAEETGLIVMVDRTVCRAAIDAACARGARTTWRRATFTSSLNLSARTLQEAGIAEELIGMLAEAGIPPSRIVLEVTEGVLIDDDQVSARLQRLRADGVRVALDDFGTGWSSLSYLRRTPSTWSSWTSHSPRRSGPTRKATQSRRPSSNWLARCR